MSTELEQVVKENGFADETEFHRMVAMVDLSSPYNMASFRRWQFQDGTKQGLLEVIEGTIKV